MKKLVPIIGMEIHVELKTKSKMFCGCKNEPDRDLPNNNICPVCTAQPGTLPVPNKTAVEWAVKLATALGCKINKISKFDRKHYFYPDLPKAYQISQYDEPIGECGKIDLEFVAGKNHRDSAVIGITRVHLEEDTAKLTHADGGSTLVDFNRAGIPLVEIVSDPDIQSGTEAKLYCQELQSIFRCLKISDADMEKGHMRCEVNVSMQEDGKFSKAGNLIRPVEKYKLNPKVEVKNINSFRAVEKAIDYEIKRQTEMLEKGGTWIQCTRGWDDSKGETVLQREKETSADYRYFPEPDIPPIIFTKAQVAKIKETLPELPDQKIQNYKTKFALSDYDADQIANDLDFSRIYDSILEKYTDNSKLKDFAKFVANLFLGAIKTHLNEEATDLKINKINPDHYIELFDSVQKSEISATVAKQVIVESYLTGKNPVEIAKVKGLIQVSDSGEIEKIAKEVIESNPKAVEDYRKNPNSIGFLIGQLMKASHGSANPQMAKEILEKLLN